MSAVGMTVCLALTLSSGQQTTYHTFNTHYTHTVSIGDDKHWRRHTSCKATFCKTAKCAFNACWGYEPRLRGPTCQHHLHIRVNSLMQPSFLDGVLGGNGLSSEASPIQLILLHSLLQLYFSNDREGLPELLVHGILAIQLLYVTQCIHPQPKQLRHGVVAAMGEGREGGARGPVHGILTIQPRSMTYCIYDVQQQPITMHVGGRKVGGKRGSVRGVLNTQLLHMTRCTHDFRPAALKRVRLGEDIVCMQS